MKMASQPVRSALTKFSTIAAPSPSGPNTVGTSIVGITDFSRYDPYTSVQTPREVLVRFWYPSRDPANCVKAVYASTKVWNRFEELIGIHLPTVDTNSCLNVPLTDGLHPIVVFTPGYTGTNTDYTFLFEDLASRGHVVASVDHKYKATAVEFPDGRIVNSILGSHPGGPFDGDASSMAFAVSVRLQDLKFLLDELERMNADSGNLLADKLDTSRIAVAGHSMGGVTALLALEKDARFRAGVLIDPGFTFVPDEATASPVAILAMGRSQWSRRNADCGMC